jgi:acylglycerol lipase
MRLAPSFIFLTVLVACAPQFHPGGERTAVPVIDDQALVTADQIRLPLRQWPATSDTPKAIVIALHGFNDYSRAFDLPANWWANEGLTVYAFDQRGFGEAPHPGYWSATPAMAADLYDAVRAINQRHADLPIYLLGSSMGAAVILAALGNPEHHIVLKEVEGVILVGPAVWGPKTMNPFYRFILWLGAHTVPANHLTGEGLRIKPSDNIPMLRALGRDPLIIKSTRVDTLYGLVDLMGAALEGAREINQQVLVLAAGDDQLIPGHAHQELLKALKSNRTEATYPDGFHMLLRDLQAKTVWRDIMSWIGDKSAPLPSGLGHKIKSPKATVR